MTKADFVDWKRHPVTQQVMSQLQTRVDTLIEEMIEQSFYADPRILAEKGAAIKAYRDLITIQYEEGEDSNGN